MSEDQKKGRRPRQRRTPKRRVRDRLRISQMYVYDGKTQGEIAKELGLSAATVNRALQELETGWKAEAEQHYRVWKQMLVDEALYQLEEWYVAWQKSKLPREVDSTKQSAGADGKKVEVSKRTEGRAGNPSFLNGAGQTLDRLMKLTGLDVQKIAPTNPDGTQEYKPFSLEDFGYIIAAARQYEETLQDGRSTPE
jgi:transposase